MGVHHFYYCWPKHECYPENAKSIELKFWYSGDKKYCLKASFLNFAIPIPKIGTKNLSNIKFRIYRYYLKVFENKTTNFIGFLGGWKLC